MTQVDLDVPTSDGEVRPSWRGQLHRYFAIAGVPAFVVLAFLAKSTTATVAMVVYGLGVTGMLGVSAVYHSGRLGTATKAVFKRIDHVTILFAIAGSYTAVTVLALDGSNERFLLVFVWSATVVGAAIRMFWLHAPRWVVSTVYLVVGWSALLEIAPLSRSLNAIDITLLVVGGGLYTVGAVIYAAKRPNPWPRHFGFHEVFHALVVAAATIHYVLVVRLVGD
jgi:hemolysin III